MSRKSSPLKMRGLLNDENVKRWYANLEQGSKRTAEEYLRWLADYCYIRKTAPSKLIKEMTASKKRSQDRLQDYILGLEGRKSSTDGKGLKPKTRHFALCAIKSWFQFNELPVTRIIKIKDARSTPTIEDEHIPTHDELRKILDGANPRSRVAISTIAFLGIRPEAISLMVLGDYPELDIKEPKALKEPMLVKIRAEISKNRRPYLTFLVGEGIKYLIGHLEERKLNGETLNVNSPLVPVATSTRTQGALRQKGSSVGRQAISAIIRRVMRSTKTSVSNFRPYVLRSYYDWAIQNAEGLPFVWEQFFMGHSGPVEANYSVNKNLRDKQIEQMRTAFKEKVEPELSTSVLPEGVSKDDLELIRYESKLDMAEMVMEFPVTSNDAVKIVEDRLDRPLASHEKLALFKAIVERLGEGHTSKDETGEIRNWISFIAEEHEEPMESLHRWIADKKSRESKGPEKHETSQDVVPVSQLKSRLATGEWRFVAKLETGDIIIERNH
ncbi:MAG TPA: hypothetical protein VGR53_00535 [Nitrososphaerales archaeon]|nr:hypothetical protein [Nitrososphaerales archaeon]